MSVLKQLKTLQHVSIFSDHLQGARKFLVKFTDFKSFKVFKILKTNIFYVYIILLYIEVH
jgi:hypothetical protein